MGITLNIANIMAAASVAAALCFPQHSWGQSTDSEIAAPGDTAQHSPTIRTTQLDSLVRASQKPLALPYTAKADVSPLVITPDAYGKLKRPRDTQMSIYGMPYSLTGTCHDWRRLWINTGVLGGAFVGTLFVLEMLPEDATSWNRAALQRDPLFKRWKKHVIQQGPEWDHDKFVFNYMLHPYAGAVYFMGARSNGFNFYQSLLYTTLVSTVGWEFGIEAFMERPSYQDIMITPLVGAFVGEGFYRIKRHLVENDYRLLGSPVLGNIVAFLVDPINEVVGLFDHNPARRIARLRHSDGSGVQLSLSPNSLTLTATF